MEQSALLALRGLLDIILGCWLAVRFSQVATSMPTLRTRLVQMTLFILVVIFLEWIGIWHRYEVVAAFSLLPIIWPLLLIMGWLAYRAYRLRQKVAKLEFEVDWRREYQDVIMEELEKDGKVVTPPPYKDTHTVEK